MGISEPWKNLEAFLRGNEDFAVSDYGEPSKPCHREGTEKYEPQGKRF
jgi:hypothetical protein